MPRVWLEQYSSTRHSQPMRNFIQGRRAVERYLASPTIHGHKVLLVRVCGFTFTFHSIDELEACRCYYSKKILPSRRSHVAAQAVRNRTVGWRWEVERWNERLPLYLREDAKRSRVARALDQALFDVSLPNGRLAKAWGGRAPGPSNNRWRGP